MLLLFVLLPVALVRVLLLVLPPLLLLAALVTLLR
jgi:hypothetical protein